MVNYKIPTRIKDKNKFLYNRPACPLPDNGLLPTKADVDLAIEFKLETLAVTQKMSNGVVQKVILEVVRELEAIWGRLVPSIQLQDFHNIVRKVKRMRIDRQSELSFVGQYNDLKRLDAPDAGEAAVPDVQLHPHLHRHRSGDQRWQAEHVQEGAKEGEHERDRQVRRGGTEGGEKG